MCHAGNPESETGALRCTGSEFLVIYLSLLIPLPSGCQAMLKVGSQMPERGLWLFASLLLTSGVAAVLPQWRLFLLFS